MPPSSAIFAPSVFDVDAATTSPIGIGRRSYEPADGREENHNTGDVYLLALPCSRGRVRLERYGAVLHDGPVRPGMVRVVAPGERSSMAARSRFEAVVLRVSATTFERASGGNLAGAVHLADREVARLCPTLASTVGLRGRRRDLVAEGLATALIGLMLAQPAGPRPGTGLTDAQFVLAEHYAEERLREGLRLERWAAVLDLDARAFARRFSAHTGSSPYAWFMERRVTESMRILTTTDLSIVDVALAMGFSSQSHFTDAFRRRTGLAPGAWRARSER